MNGYLTWLTGQPTPTRRIILAAMAALAVALVALATLLPPAAPWIGALAGATLFAAATGTWHTILTPDRQAATDLKARLPLARRRTVVLALAAIWVIALLLVVGTLLPAVGGTLTVWVVLHLAWLFRATPAEAAAQKAAWEEAQARAAAEEHQPPTVP